MCQQSSVTTKDNAYTSNCASVAGALCPWGGSHTAVRGTRWLAWQEARVLQTTYMESPWHPKHPSLPKTTSASETTWETLSACRSHVRPQARGCPGYKWSLLEEHPPSQSSLEQRDCRWRLSPWTATPSKETSWS